MRNLSFDGKFSLRESNLSLSFFFSDLGSFEFGQSSSQSSGFLGSQTFWLVFFTVVQLSNSLSLVQVDNSQNSSNGFSDIVDFW